MLNREHPNSLSRERFRDILINTFNLAGGGQYIQYFLRDLGIRDRYGKGSSDFYNLYDQFQKYGCIEYRGDGFRFLLISRFSELNGDCRQ